MVDQHCSLDLGVEARISAKRQRCEEPQLETLLAELDCLRLKLAQAEQRVKELDEECGWEWKHVCVSSPLTAVAHNLRFPRKSGWAWKWFEAFCPCCKRPLDVTMLRVPATELGSVTRADDLVNGNINSDVSEQECNEFNPHSTSIKDWSPGCPKNTSLPAASKDPSTRFAQVAVLWGSQPGYVLGALVLGARLREMGTRAELVLMHTDDVPPNHLELLRSDWQLRLVDYIDGVSGLYSSKGHRFDGVFTKINAWSATEYNKVLLLDIDLIPLGNLDDLFDLETPAAFVRGGDDLKHGSPVNGRAFFSGEQDTDWAWQQAGGINAGVILLQPCMETYFRMVREVTSEVHPEHLPGNGPEQDYFSRFFASAPWHHISVAYNFQLHHVPFALERALAWLGAVARPQVAAGDTQAPQGSCKIEDSWLSQRFLLPLGEVRNVHFSGEMKLWDRLLLQRDGSNAKLETDEEFSERFLHANLEGYQRWLRLAASPEEYLERGCQLQAGGRVLLVADKSDITPLVNMAVTRVRSATVLAAKEWRECAERLISRSPGILQAVHDVSLPLRSPWPLGVRLEALWNGDYHPCVVEGVHADGAYVVRYCQRDSQKGFRERRVALERLRLIGHPSEYK